MSQLWLSPYKLLYISCTIYVTSGFYIERKLDHGPLKVTAEFTWGGKAGGLGRSKVARDHRYRIEGTLWAELNKTEKQKTVPHYSRGVCTYQLSASGISVNSPPLSGDTRDSQVLGSREKRQRRVEPRTQACLWKCERLIGGGWGRAGEGRALRLVPEVSYQG